MASSPSTTTPAALVQSRQPRSMSRNGADRRSSNPPTRRRSWLQAAQASPRNRVRSSPTAPDPPASLSADSKSG
jgi:hypothetical protein